MRNFITLLIVLSLPISVLAQSMGVNLPASTLPNTMLDVNGGVSFREGTALSLANGVNSDIALTNYSFFRIIGPTAAFSITGFGNGTDGRSLTIVNASTQNMTLTHQATSAAANQINTGGSAIVLPPNGVAKLIYNLTLTKWIVSGTIGNSPNLLNIGNGALTDSLMVVNNGVPFKVSPVGFIETYAWGLDGNSGTVDGTNFIGTTDNIPFNIKVNNFKAGRIDHLNYNAFYGFMAGNANTGTRNSFFGHQAGSTNTSGINNTGLGYGALGVNTTASNNIAVGSGAMESNTTGYDNVAIGRHSMRKNITSYNNTAVGTYSLGENLGGYYNTAMGWSALNQNTSGFNNTAVGAEALLANITGNSNAAYGIQSLYFNTSGNYNTSIGIYSMFKNTSGNNNVALGALALGENSTAWGNTAIGYKALGLNTTANGLVAVGDSALYANTTGTGNTAMGYQALSANTTGVSNTAIGYGSMSTNTIGTTNTAVGQATMVSNTTGSQNTALGQASLVLNTTGTANTALGQTALFNNTTGTNNTAIGVASLYNNTGSYNVAVGGAMFINTSGNNNTATGYLAMNNFQTGSNNVVMGYQAMSGSGTASANTGSNNIAIGYQAHTSAASATNNVSIGYQAGQATTTGNNSVSVGYQAGLTNQTGGNNTFIGYQADATAIALSNAAAIGYNAKVAANNSMVLGGTGANAVFVGMGTTTPAYKVHIEEPGGYNGDIGVRLYNTNNSGYLPSLILQTSRGTKTTPTAVTSGTILGAVRYGGYDGSAFTDLYAGELRGNATENWSTTAHGTSLNFGTIANGTTTLLDRMIIDQNGRVGIGTSTPNQQLEITNAFRFPSTTSSTTGVIYKDANRFIHNYKPAANDGNNTFVGVNAGNFTMTSATSWLASGNTGIGNNALAAITDAGYNTAVGNTALQAVTTGSYNTGLGNSALKANTTGAGNTAVGNNALQANTTAGGCTAVGNGALNSNTIGISNTAVGESTLNLNTTGTFNTTIGQASLRDNTTGSFNTGCGLSALQANTTGNYNTAVGVSSLVGNLTGNNNTAVGFDALVATTSSNNVGFGYLAGVGNTSGANNTFLGYNTGATNTTGSNNTLIGYQANVASSALTNAAAIGYNASVSVSNSFVLGGTGANAVNVGIGLTAPSVKLHQDGGNATATYHKFTAGTTTGQTASDGFDIGIDASGNAYLDQNENAAMVFNTNNAEQMQISSAGNILIGALTPGEVTGVAVVNQSASDLKDDVTITTYNTTTTPAFVIFKARGTAAAPTSLTNNETIGGFNANGYTGSAFTGLTAVSTTTASDFTTSFGADLTFKTSRSGTSSERMRIMSTGNVGIGVTAPSHILQINGQGRATNSAWATTSDRRLKDIDGTFDYGLKELLKINTVRFHYKKDNPLALPTDRAFQGIIAQDLQTVIPEAVTKMPDGYLTVSTDPVFWTMLNAIKELDAKVEALTNENTILKTKLAELDALKTDIEKIKKAIGIDTSAKK